MYYYLFGSRARGTARLVSDIDIFCETREDADRLPPEWLISAGGPVDAFEMPGSDGWAYPITNHIDDDRMLLTVDKWGLLVDPIEISWRALCLLVAAVSSSSVFTEGH